MIGNEFNDYSFKNSAVSILLSEAKQRVSEWGGWSGIIKHTFVNNTMDGIQLLFKRLQMNDMKNVWSMKEKDQLI